MNPRKNARAYQRRGRCYFTTGFGSTSAGFVGLGLNPGVRPAESMKYRLSHTRVKPGLFPK